MGKIYTNSDLFYRRINGEDQLFVVASPPQSTPEGYKISIKGNRPAAVLQRFADHYDQPCTVEQIQSGLDDDYYLLSGGVLVTDQCGRTAIGLRDGNGPDPFVFTNIGAGRCDGEFGAHCLHELAEELILCVREEERWIQVCFFPETPPLPLDILRKKCPDIAFWNSGVTPAGLPKKLELSGVTVRAPRDAKNTSRLLVEWIDDSQAVLLREELYGYIYLDRQNHTLEFRLPRTLELSAYHLGDTAIFFAEGTGYAKWCCREELKQLAAANMTTPLLKYFSGLL